MARGPDVAELDKLIQDPYCDWPLRYPERRAFGCICRYSPLEVLHAAGYVPVRLMQLSRQVSLASAYLPSFTCALAKAVTERMLSHELEFLSGVLFSHTCDTMQCLVDIWRMANAQLKVVTHAMPTVLTAANSRAFLLGELYRLAGTLKADFGSEVHEDALRASIRQYNQQRRLLRSLYEQRQNLTAEQLWRVTATTALMPVEESNVLLHSLLQGTKGGARSSNRGPRVVLVGAVLDDPTIPRLIDELGARVVGDDLCTGNRAHDVLVDEHTEPFEALAERYLERAACPVKHVAPATRGQRLQDLVEKTGAQGVIFVLPKFCDPHAFDHVTTSELLDQKGVPHTLVETEVSTPVGPMRTRLQAFFELLQ